MVIAVFFVLVLVQLLFCLEARDCEFDGDDGLDSLLEQVLRSVLDGPWRRAFLPMLTR
jgi:hypothetical protein